MNPTLCFVLLVWIILIYGEGAEVHPPSTTKSAVGHKTPSFSSQLSFIGLDNSNCYLLLVWIILISGEGAEVHPPSTTKSAVGHKTPSFSSQFQEGTVLSFVLSFIDLDNSNLWGRR